MAKKKHHYVPKFYLRHFASSNKRINIFNLRTSFAFPDAPLRDQCYRPHFHGQDDDLEDSLSVIEDLLAPVIRTIVETSRLPPRGTDNHRLLLLFLALQEARSAVTSDHWTNTSRKAADLILDSYEHATERQLKKEIIMDNLEATKISLANSWAIYEGFQSLGSHLLINEGPHRFITSDNPIFKYNLYCEGARGTGILGVARSGFMIFAPLSPSLVLLLYDREVYKVGTRGSDSTVVSDVADVKQLNLMQAVGAEATLLFSDWEDLEHVRSVAAKAKSHRAKPRNSVTEWVRSDWKKNESVIWMHAVAPVLKLRLSFLSILRRARRLSLNERLLRYRKATGLDPLPGLPCQPNDPRWRRKR